MKILVTAIPGVGNTLLAVPMLKELKEAFPKARIDLLVGLRSSAEIMKGCPYIDKIYIVNKNFQKGLLRNLSVVMNLRNKNYDTILTTIPAKQTHYNLLTAFIGAKKRVTHDYKSGLVVLQNCRIPLRICHDAEQNLNLLKSLGINPRKKQPLELWLSSEEKRFGDRFVKKFKERVLVGMHPGTSVERGMMEKRWSLENFAEVANRLLEYKKSSRLLVFLGPEDKPLERIKELMKEKNRKRLTIVKDLSIRKVAAIIGKCKFFITNDSGLMHIAVAMNVPTAGIFISTDYRRTAPKGEKHTVIKKDETYRVFRQSLEELSGINTGWKDKKVRQVSVGDVMKVIKRKI